MISDHPVINDQLCCQLSSMLCCYQCVQRWMISNESINCHDSPLTSDCQHSSALTLISLDQPRISLP
eukprot:g39373.t1